MSRDVEGFGILGLGASARHADNWEDEAVDGQGPPHTGSET